MESNQETGRIEVIGYEIEVFEGDPAKGESRFSATVPALPTIMAHGETMAELHDSAIKGISFMVDDLMIQGKPVPPPSSIGVHPTRS